ncbi:hypothetical protein ACKWTF_015327 [Chironomus riparius]
MKFVIICAFICFSGAIDAEAMKCDYKLEPKSLIEPNNSFTSYYSCVLNSGQVDLTKIDGNHKTERSDADVKMISTQSGTKLNKLTSIFCETFPNLERIELKEANLESIDENSLQKCENLKFLVINGHKIREFPENFLQKNSKLTELFASENQLTTLPENLFKHQENLKSLNLGKNQIKSLPNNIFRPLVKLTTLSLNNNQLQSINPEWFKNVQNLKWLDLNNNQIIEVPSKSFASQRNLEGIMLMDNKIKALHSDSFEGLQKLKSLVLDNNQISDLPVGVFVPLKNLTALTLRSNELTTIHSDSFGNHEYLTIDLDSNKIKSYDKRLMHKITTATVNMMNNVCSTTLHKSPNHQFSTDPGYCSDNYQPRS